MSGIKCPEIVPKCDCFWIFSGRTKISRTLSIHIPDIFRIFFFYRASKRATGPKIFLLKFIMLLIISNKQCIKCCNEYTDMEHKWCKPCQRNHLKINFTKWTSGNKQVDSFIQKKQLEIDHYTDIVFEWIPYNQFNDIKELGKSDFTTAYSAVWRDGILYYD